MLNRIRLGVVFLVLYFTTPIYSNGIVNRTSNEILRQAAIQSNHFSRILSPQSIFPPQDSQITLRCMTSSMFYKQTTGGYLVITCLKSRNQLWNSMSAYYMAGLLRGTNEVTNTWNRGKAYLERDSVVGGVLLSCAVGFSVYPRSQVFRNTGRQESYSFAVGVTNLDQIQCKASCIPILPNFPYGRLNCSDDNFLGSRCSTVCEVGYSPRGARESTCSGTNVLRGWVPHLSTSCEVSCPAITLQHGHVTCNDGNFVGSTCTYSCGHRYTLRGNSTVTCDTRELTWEPRGEVSCVATKCTALEPRITNGNQVCINGSNQFSHCILHCYAGFEPVGSSLKWCIPENVNGERKLVWKYGNATHLMERRIQRFECRPIVGFTNGPSAIRGQINSTGFGTHSLRRFDTCDIAPVNRIDCGYEGIPYIQCLRRGCCWDSSVDGTIWCFRRSINPTNQAQKTNNPNPANHLRIPEPTNIQSQLTIGPSQPSYGNPMSYSGTGNSMLHTCGCADEATERHCAVQARESSGRILNSEAASRVYCGEAARASQWPWQALLLFDDRLCGGTLLAARYVLTAAHCVQTDNPARDSLHSNYVVFGQLNSTSTQVKYIDSIRRHPNFSSTFNHVRNDVAIIRLASAVDISSNSVGTLCLPASRPSPGDECFITGYGRTRAGGDSSSYGKLKAARIPITTAAECRRLFGAFLPEQNICAGSSSPNEANTCRGDSGGPLACRQPGATSCGWYLAGITSYGLTECGTPSPGVYVDVLAFKSWILRTLHHFVVYGGA